MRARQTPTGRSCRHARQRVTAAGSSASSQSAFPSCDAAPGGNATAKVSSRTSDCRSVVRLPCVDLAALAIGENLGLVAALAVNRYAMIPALGALLGPETTSRSSIERAPVGTVAVLVGVGVRAGILIDRGRRLIIEQATPPPDRRKLLRGFTFPTYSAPSLRQRGSCGVAQVPDSLSSKHLRQTVRSLLALVGVAASVALTLVLPGIASGTTLVQARSQLRAWHLGSCMDLDGGGA